MTKNTNPSEDNVSKHQIAYAKPVDATGRIELGCGCGLHFIGRTSRDAIQAHEIHLRQVDRADRNAAILDLFRGLEDN